MKLIGISAFHPDAAAAAGADGRFGAGGGEGRLRPGEDPAGSPRGPGWRRSGPGG